MRKLLVYSIVAFMFAGLFGGSTGYTRAAVADNEQQLTEFDPPFDSSSCAGVPVMTHSETGKTLIAFIQPDASEPYDGMLVVGLLDADGALASELVEVSTTHPSDAPTDCAPPSVAVGPDGTWLVVWPSNEENSIYGQIISTEGTLSGGSFVISDDIYSDIETVSAAWSADDERFLVTWKARVADRDVSLEELNPQQIVGQFVDSAGSAMGTNFLVTNYASGVDNNQDLAFGNGIWINVHGKSVPPGAGNRPYGQIISAEGLQGEPFALYFDDQYYYGPGIAYNQYTEQFAVSFWENIGIDSKRIRLLDNEGVPIGTETIFEYEGPRGGGTRPRLLVNGTEGYLMTWSMYNADSTGIRAQFFDSNLEAIGETVQVSSDGLDAWRSEATCSAEGIILSYWGWEDAAMNVYTNTLAGCEVIDDDPVVNMIGRTRLVGSTTEFADDRVRWAWLRCTRDGDVGSSSRLPLGCRIVARGSGLGSSLERKAYRVSAADRRARYMRVAIYADGEWHYSSALSVR